MIQGITFQEIQYIIRALPVEWGEVDARAADRFENILYEPFLIRGRRDPYPTLEKKAALLFYLLVKHANPSLASMGLLIFLSKNNGWLKVDSQEFAQFALWVADSPSMVKAQTVEAVEVFLKRYVA